MDPRLLQDIVTLFVVVNPIGLVPLYLSAVRGRSPEAQIAIARRATIISGVILIAFIVAGQVLLTAMGIKMASFRIAGGLVLLILGLKMVLDEGKASSGNDPAEMERDVAVFPIAMPFIAGPGTIMTVVLLTDNDRFSIPEQAETAVMLIGVLAFTWVMMRLAERIHRQLGDTGVNILSRVMGLILTSMAVESILTGIRASFAK